MVLDETAGLLGPDARQRLAAQVAFTLRELPGVSAVRVLVSRTPLNVPGAGDVIQLGDLASFDPDGLPVGTVGYYADDKDVIVTVAGREVAGSSAPLSAPALSPDAGRIAALTPSGEGVALVTGEMGKDLVERVVARRLTPPSLGAGDEGVFTWRETAEGSGLVVVRDDGAVDPVRADQLAPGGDVAGPVTQVQVSRDGTRVAVVAGEGDRGRVYVGRLVPVGSGPGGRVPLQLVGLRAVAPVLGAVTDVAWADSEDLVAVGLVSRDSQPSAWTFTYDGSFGVRPLTTNGAVPESVAAAPEQPLLIGAQKQVWVVKDGTAMPIGPGSDPAYPG